jgi:mannose-6-phosphate isomerase-like protein (cupin superfamily)
LLSEYEEGCVAVVENIKHNSTLLAMIVRAQFQKNGIEFFTPDHFSQQLAYMKRQEGYSITPHVHNSVLRNIQLTQEVLFIKTGKVRVDFYDEQKQYLESRILNSGDIILLAQGGHGFVMLEESEIIEVKQGPYAGDQDKTRFESVSADKIKMKD